MGKLCIDQIGGNVIHLLKTCESCKFLFYSLSLQLLIQFIPLAGTLCIRSSKRKTPFIPYCKERNVSTYFFLNFVLFFACLVWKIIVKIILNDQMFEGWSTSNGWHILLRCGQYFNNSVFLQVTREVHSCIKMLHLVSVFYF